MVYLPWLEELSACASGDARLHVCTRSSHSCVSRKSPPGSKPPRRCASSRRWIATRGARTKARGTRGQRRPRGAPARRPAPRSGAGSSAATRCSTSCARSTAPLDPDEIAELLVERAATWVAGAVLGRRVGRSVTGNSPCWPAAGSRPTWTPALYGVADWVMRRGEEFATANLQVDPSRPPDRCPRASSGVSAYVPRPARRRAHRVRSRDLDAREPRCRPPSCGPCVSCSSRCRRRSTTRCCSSAPKSCRSPTT